MNTPKSACGKTKFPQISTQTNNRSSESSPEDGFKPSPEVHPTRPLRIDTLEPKGHRRCFLISTSRKCLIQPLSARAPLPQHLEISECAQVSILAFSRDRVVLHLCPTKSPILLGAPEFAVPEFHFLLSLNKGGGPLPTLMGEFPSLLHTRNLP